MTRRSPATLPRLPWRLTALVGALLVWLLGVMAVSPELHGHAGCSECAPTPEEHVCAVTLFAHGAENPAEFAPDTGAPTRVVVAAVRPEGAAMPPAADVRTPPGQGPPAR